ncbi:unnamed protein product [Oppiella nova]|uniref:Uncharacterized protein n=1 Tax=Oppiella nova TaxID=334625 RepID=A0A7R9MQB1_9ACAR|nr:unnamed protein product [Oppiella nova]CAG2181110.1 unnamed protein product [Oppiella nova]
MDSLTGGLCLRLAIDGLPEEVVKFNWFTNAVIECAECQPKVVVNLLVVIIDMANSPTVIRRPISADWESAIMNPHTKVIALRSIPLNSGSLESMTIGTT